MHTAYWTLKGRIYSSPASHSEWNTVRRAMTALESCLASLTYPDLWVYYSIWADQIWSPLGGCLWPLHIFVTAPKGRDYAAQWLKLVWSQDDWEFQVRRDLVASWESVKENQWIPERDDNSGLGSKIPLQWLRLLFSESVPAALQQKEKRAKG